ncbi:MBL fold metallo-hydrolase [Paenibacillus sp. FSL R7-0210]|uniref:MBL fold metallo-hydrolase n=1 Tax=Paenibacillus sp. FSL R7-0210 TaxID=2921676 RepID=UPI0030F931DC
MFRVEEVAQGVWAAIVIPGLGAVGNASIIDLGDSTVVVDTFNLPAAARLLREKAEKLTGKPVKYIINTHYHGDHHYGNQEFSDSIILSTELTREVLRTHAPPALEEWQDGLRKQITGLQEKRNTATDSRLRQALINEISDKQALLEATPTIRRVTAAVTFKDSVDIHGSARSLHLFTYGGGHTLSDAMVYVADVQVLIAGDLVLNRFHPAMLHGFPEAWTTIIEQIGGEIDFTRLIPGHGDVAGRESIPDMLRYLKEIQEYAATAARSRESAEHWIAKGIPEPFDTWKGSHIFEWNFRWLFNTYTDPKKRGR